MQRQTEWNLTSNLLFRRHCRPIAAAWIQSYVHVMATFLLYSNVESTGISIQVWQRTVHLTSHLTWGSVACLAGLSSVRCCSWMHLYGHHVFAYGPTVLTNPESQWRTCCRVHLLCPPDNDTDYNKKLDCLKNIMIAIAHARILALYNTVYQCMYLKWVSCKQLQEVLVLIHYPLFTVTLNMLQACMACIIVPFYLRQHHNMYNQLFSTNYYK